MSNRRSASHARGFTLIELLAVIAIIGILAAIVVPNVAGFIRRSQIAAAVSDIKNAETALIGVLSDTGRSSFRDLLNQGRRGQLDTWSGQIGAGNFNAVRAASNFYGEFFYELLRQGRNSDFIAANVDPTIRQKLAPSYIDLGNDPWGNRYQFWMGPLRKGPMILRSYRVRTDITIIPDDPDFTSANAYVYNQARRDEAQLELPGQPKKDNVSLPDEYTDMFGNIQAYGFPAPKDEPVYIWSVGNNLTNDAHLLFQMQQLVDQDAPEFLGGGDDPNSWDNAAGWDNAPR